MLHSLDDWLAVFAFFNRPQLLRLLFVNRFVRKLIDQHFGQRPYGYGILRLVLPWNENKTYSGTEGDECLVGMAICDRRLEYLEQENRQFKQTLLLGTVRYEWDLSNHRCMQWFENGAHEHCATDWRLLGPSEATLVYCDRAFEHGPHLAADEEFKRNEGNKQYRVAQRLYNSWMLLELYENDFRQVGTDSGLTMAVRIALSDIDIIMSHLAPKYVRLFSIDFSVLGYLSKYVWKTGSSTSTNLPTDRRRQTAEKIVHLLARLVTIDGIFDAAKISLPLGPLGHMFGDTAPGHASFCHILQLLGQSAKLCLKQLSDDDAEIMSTIRVWPNVLLHNCPLNLNKLELVIHLEDFDIFGKEFWLNQVGQLLHTPTIYDSALRRYRLRSIKLSLNWLSDNRTKIGQFVQDVIERLYQNFMSCSSAFASTSGHQADKLPNNDHFFYKCVLNIRIDLSEAETWHEYPRFSALFLPKSLISQSQQHAHSSAPNFHLLNESGQHWRLQCSPSRQKWQWKIWCYSGRTEHIALDKKLEEQDQRMRGWWYKCEQLSSAAMFGHGNFNPMMVYDERTRIRVINRKQK